MRLFLLLTALMVVGTARPVRAQLAVPGEIVVQLKSDLVDPGFLLDLGGVILDKSEFAPCFRLKFGLLVDLNLVIKLLMLDPRVAVAELNLVLRSRQSSSPGQQWCSTFDGREGMTAYQTQSAVSQVGFKTSVDKSQGENVTVAVLDTGISSLHPELQAQLKPGWNYVDNNANTDDVPDYKDNDGNGKKDEATGHGTVVAGIVHRFAPKANLLAVKVLNSDGVGTLWAVSEGIRYASAKGATVINMSLGAPRNSGYMSEAISDAYGKGVVMVASAGNNDTSVPQFPAGNPQVITVAALNGDNTKASFSNYGAAIDVDAPGVWVVGTYWDGRYAAWSGTSVSAPIVAAQAALLRSIAPSRSVEDIRTIILKSSVSVDPWNPSYIGKLGKNGAGLIQFDESLKQR